MRARFQGGIASPVIAVVAGVIIGLVSLLASAVAADTPIFSQFSKVQ
jgi:branched-subunit amino acid ABC-type transport system permease component